MFLSEANDLLLPYLENPGFEAFEAETPRLVELTKQISDAMSDLETRHPLGMRCIRVDEDTELAFLEFAAICKEGLKSIPCLESE